jgi:KH domain
MGVQVDQSALPQKPVLLSPPSESTTSIARIDDAEDTTAVETQWQVVPNYQDAEEGDSEWTLRARDQGALETAEKLVKDAIEHAQKMTHIGFLTLTDRSAFPRIVGTRGATVARLRIETGADITVGKDNNTIVIIGTSVNHCRC